jgi:hypothetical protein
MKVTLSWAKLVKSYGESETPRPFILAGAENVHFLPTFEGDFSLPVRCVSPFPENVRVSGAEFQF